MFVKVFMLDPRHAFQHAESRPRYWFMLIPKAAVAGICESECHAAAENMIDDICAAADIISLSDILLPDDDQLIQDYLQQCMQRGRSKAEGCGENSQMASSRKRKWPTEHEQAAQKLGLRWWDLKRPSSQKINAYPGLAVLTDREFDRLAMIETQLKRWLCSVIGVSIIIIITVSL